VNSTDYGDFAPEVAPVGSNFAMTRMSDVEPTQVEWTWRGRIPRGCVSLVVAKPGSGKSFTMIDIAAHVTTGRTWPDGAECEKGEVILFSAEDDPSKTIRPRLIAQRADSTKVHLVRGVVRESEVGGHGERFPSLRDITPLENALVAYPDVALVVVDPVGSYLGGDTDAHRDNEVRTLLNFVAKLAENYCVAVVLVVHRRKQSGADADALALGSVAFSGVARAVWHIFIDKDDHARRFFLPGKMNLCA